MAYIVTEVQTFNDGTSAIPAGYPVIHNDINAAYSQMHSVLAYAATSTVPEHSCFITDAKGNRLDGQTFIHPTETVTV